MPGAASARLVGGPRRRASTGRAPPSQNEAVRDSDPRSRSRTNRESRLHVRLLNDLFERRGFSARRDALEYFGELVSSGRARTMHFNAMLQFCVTSDEMRRVLDEDMPRAAVRPDVGSLNALAMQLRLEGDEDAAWQVMDDMVGPDWGMHWDLSTWSIATVSEADLKEARLRRFYERDEQEVLASNDSSSDDASCWTKAFWQIGAEQSRDIHVRRDYAGGSCLAMRPMTLC